MTRTIPLPPQIVVKPGVRCFGCGYDLRGLPSLLKCPECGKPISCTTASRFAQVVRRRKELKVLAWFAAALGVWMLLWAEWYTRPPGPRGNSAPTALVRRPFVQTPLSAAYLPGT